MDYLEEQHAREVLRENYLGQDIDAYAVLHFDSWSTYEENGWMFILEKDGNLFALEYAYSVFGDHSSNTPCWEPYPVTQEQALALMVEWDDIERREIQ